MVSTSSSIANNFGGGVTVSAPAGQRSGDFLVAVAGANGTATTWTAPAGWSPGTNSAGPDGQQLRWWSLVVPSTPAASYKFSANSYTDGGIVIIDFRGVAAVNPVQAVSLLATNDNSGNGNVTTAAYNSASWTGSATVVTVLLTSWQPTQASITWPAGFSQLATANDGYGFVAVAANLTSASTTGLSAQAAHFSVSQAVIPTIQIALNVGS